MKKVLILTASARKNGNSERLAQEFAKGAQAVGHQVETIRLYDQSYGWCKGCLACQKTQKCVINDAAIEIAEKMKNADVLVFATPVYYYAVSGQLKTMLDRANPLYASDYKFRDIYLLVSAAEGSLSAFEGSEKDVQGWVDCFAKAKLAGTVFAGGVGPVGAIEGHDSLVKAFELGKSL